MPNIIWPKRLDLAALIVLFFLLNLSIFDGKSFPIADTALTYEFFYVFYNHFYFFHSFPQWLPQYAFGLPSSYFQLCLISPFDYFWAVAGSLLQIKNTLLVFKLSLLTEHLFFLTGVYMLARRIFYDRMTVFIVSLSSLASFIWFDQIHNNHRIAYAVPWVLYWLVLFYQRPQAKYFWTMVFFALFSLVGNCFYFPVLWFWTLAAFAGVVFYPSYKEYVKASLRPRILSWGGLAGAALFLFLFWLSLNDFKEFVHISQRVSLGNSLHTFLTYGDNLQNLSTYLSMALGSSIGMYIGFFPCIFLLWAITRVRQKLFMAFSMAGVFVVLLSFGGGMAAVFYFLPGMEYYRHIGYIYPLACLFLVFMAGFGLEDFFKAGREVRCRGLIYVLAGVVFALEGLGAAREMLAGSYNPTNGLYTVGFPSNTPLLIFNLMAFVALFVFNTSRFKEENQRLRWCKILLTGVICIDIFGFQYHTLQYVQSQYKIFTAPWFANDKGRAERIFDVSRPAYSAFRPEQLPEGRARDILTMSSLPTGNMYATKYGMAQMQACRTNYRIDFLSKDFDDAPRGQVLDDIACYSPGLRLTTREGGKASDAPVDVQFYSGDRLDVRVKAPPEGAWLFFADTYHPGWRAEVNGQKAEVVRIHSAFKGVRVQGDAQVRWHFDQGWTTLLQKILPWLCTLVVLAFAVVFIRMNVKNFKGHEELI